MNFYNIMLKSNKVITIDEDNYKNIFRNNWENNIVVITTITKNTKMKIEYVIPRNNIDYIYKVESI